MVSQRSILILAVALIVPTIVVAEFPAASLPSPSGFGNGPATFNHYVTPFGGGAGETSIGINPHTNNAFFLRFTHVDRVKWDDSTSPPTPTWTDVSPAGQLGTFDPILWTDRVSGRTFVVQLLLAASQIFVTTDVPNPLGGAPLDEDGNGWEPTMPATSFPFFDHQTVGGGPHALVPGVTPDLNQVAEGLGNNLDRVTGAANAMYYCGQLGTAVCARSDDDGLTWGPYVPINAQDDCGGLTGHVVVDHAGVAYVPIKDSNSGQQCVEVSSTNGVVWATHKVPGSQNGRSDAAIAVDKADNVYVAMTSGGRPKVSISSDHGATWSNAKDVAPGFPSTANVEFSMMVAGDNGRAAMAYYGTDTAGNDQTSGFLGKWHLYVSFTYDGGQTWSAVDTTPTDPVQVGCIWLAGGGNPCRNLLDFQGATLDAHGRVVVGYADGCTATRCGPNGGSNLGTIARQTSGKGLYAAFDN